MFQILVADVDKPLKAVLKAKRYSVFTASKGESVRGEHKAVKKAREPHCGTVSVQTENDFTMFTVTPPKTPFHN